MTQLDTPGRHSQCAPTAIQQEGSPYRGTRFHSVADSASTNGTADMEITFIVPYFGHWPVSFPANLQSCKYNPSVQWLLITDCKIPRVVPANVTFIESSLDEFRALFERKTGMSVTLTEKEKKTI